MQGTVPPCCGPPWTSTSIFTWEFFSAFLRKLYAFSKFQVPRKLSWTIGENGQKYSNYLDGIKLNIQQRDVTDLKEFAGIRCESRKHLPHGVKVKISMWGDADWSTNGRSGLEPASWDHCPVTHGSSQLCLLLRNASKFVKFIHFHNHSGVSDSLRPHGL